MKKLLFIILTLLFTNELFAGCWLGARTVYNNFTCGRQPYSFTEVSRIGKLGGLQNQCLYKGKESASYGEYSFCGNSTLLYNLVNGEPHYILNPQDGSPTSCDELYKKNNIVYSCNPNTNEPEPIPNADIDENGNLVCGSGTEATSTTVLWGVGVGGPSSEPLMWNKQSCVSTGGGTGNNNIPSPSTNLGFTDNGDGSVSWSSESGENYHYDQDGKLTITSPSGQTSKYQYNADTGKFESSSSGSGGNNSGSVGTGGDGNNNGSGENPNPNPNPTNPYEPIDNEPASNSCNDSSLSLQEKMLCEMNAGIKKLNSESTPSNSLNQLMKDLNNKSTQLNDSLDTVKNNTNVTNQNLNTTNTKLDSLNTNTTQTNTKLDKLDTTLNKLDITLKDIEKNTKTTSNVLGGSTVSTGGGTGESGNDEEGIGKLDQVINNLQDEEGKSYLGKIADFVDGATTSPDDEKKASYSSQINSKVSSTLDNTFSKYSNILGFGSSYANRPENIELTIFNTTYTILDFTYLDPYINIIRSLFLALAYLYGFMNLLRSSK